MKRDEQEAFLQDLADSIIGEMHAKIQQGKIPEQWDGYELREWFAKLARESTHDGLKEDRTRYRAYNKHVLTNYL